MKKSQAPLTLAIPCNAAERVAHLMVHEDALGDLTLRHPPGGAAEP